MKKYLSGWPILTIFFGLSLYTLFAYLSEWKEVPSKFEVQYRPVYIEHLKDNGDHFNISFTSSAFDIPKSSYPLERWSEFLDIDWETSVLLGTYQNELVSVSSNGKDIISYDDFLQRKTDESSLLTLLSLLTITGVLLLFSLLVPSIENWVERKVKNEIFKIKPIHLIAPGLFNYRYKNSDILICHMFRINAKSFFNSRNYFKIYIPISSSGLKEPSSMQIASFGGEQYYSFNLRFPFSSTHQKLEQLIQSKFH